MIFTKPIELVTEDDLMRLKHDRVAEQQTIDYKGAFVRAAKNHEMVKLMAEKLETHLIS